jgi:spermidine/putrescine transport system substrate-binding protein
VLNDFTRETGSPVSVESYSSNDEMLAKLHSRPSFYDIIQPSGYYVESLARAGQLETLDLGAIPNIRNLDLHYRRLPFDPQEKYSVPWLVGTVGIVVNRERIKEPIENFADVFSGRYAGRIAVVDDAREMVAWALASLDLPITDVSDAALAKVGPVLRKWLPQVAVFDSDSPRFAFLHGQADIGIIWSGEAALLWRENRDFEFILPKRGAHRFVDNLAIPRGAPHKAVAEKFIDFCLRPEVSVKISRAYPYTNPNLAARRLLTPAEFANPASYPKIDGLPSLRNDGNSAQAVTAFVRRLRGQ